MNKKLLFIGIFFIAGFGNKVYATEFVLNTIAQFNKALEMVESGDIIIWKNGTFPDVKINFMLKTNGIPGKLIILKAENEGKVIFTGNSQIIIAGAWLMG